MADGGHASRRPGASTPRPSRRHRAPRRGLARRHPPPSLAHLVARERAGPLGVHHVERERRELGARRACPSGAVARRADARARLRSIPALSVERLSSHRSRASIARWLATTESARGDVRKGETIDDDGAAASLRRPQSGGPHGPSDSGPLMRSRGTSNVQRVQSASANAVNSSSSASSFSIVRPALGTRSGIRNTWRRHSVRQPCDRGRSLIRARARSSRVARAWLARGSREKVRGMRRARA